MGIRRIGIFVLVAVSVPFLSGCYAYIGKRHPHDHDHDRRERRRGAERHVCEPGGPPPWAPAHGYRRKCQYRYYPQYEVYFSVSAEIYFWKEEGTWHSNHSLPNHIQLSGEDYVSLELKTDKPYEQHDDVKANHGPHDHDRGKGPEKHDKTQRRGPPFDRP